MSKAEEDFSLKNFFVPLTTPKAVFILVIIGFVVYFNMLFNGFVWDDITYIIQNPEIHKFSLPVLLGKNTFNSSGYFRPLPAVYFSFIYQFFGQTAFYYHFLQLVLHLICTTLLFLIFHRFFKLSLSLFLSLIFLVHPINVESVAYIGATQSQLYLLFGGLAFYLCLQDVLSIKKILFVHLLLLLGLLTKEISVVFFLVIYLYRYLNKQIISLKFIVSSLTTFLIYLAIRLSILGVILQPMHLIPISEIPLAGRLIHIPYIFFYYLKTFIFPNTLAIDQIWTISQINWSNFYFPFLSDLLFFGLIIYLLLHFWRHFKNTFKLFVFFLVWYLACMCFFLQIFPLDMTVADRWFYFPFVGLLGMIGLSVPPVYKKYRSLCLFGAVLLLIILSVRTFVRNSDWFNQTTLYSHDLKFYDNYDLENLLGAELAFANKFPEALPHFIKSAKLLPHDTNLYNVGSVYEHLEDYSNAKKYYQQALEVRSRFANQREVRSLAFEGLISLKLISDPPDAVSGWINQALEEFPDLGTFWAFKALNEYYQNNYDAALTAAQKAKTLLPNPTTIKLYQRILNRQKIDLLLK